MEEKSLLPFLTRVAWTIPLGIVTVYNVMNGYGFLAMIDLFILIILVRSAADKYRKFKG